MLIPLLRKNDEKIKLLRRVREGESVSDWKDEDWHEDFGFDSEASVFLTGRHSEKTHTKESRKYVFGVEKNRLCISELEL